MELAYFRFAGFLHSLNIAPCDINFADKMQLARYNEYLITGKQPFNNYYPPNTNKLIR